MRIALTQMTREAQTVLAGHVDVHQGQIDQVPGRKRARGFGILGNDGTVPVRHEVLLDDFAYVLFVVDDQDGGLGTHKRSSFSLLHRLDGAPRMA